MSAAEIMVRILADSITDDGSRLVTWEWTYPRCIHAEIMTYRVISRNLASSRAIPAAKLRASILDKPYVPLVWGMNQKGMQADREIDDTTAAEAWWLRGRDYMAAWHAEGEAMGLHKQVVNRGIEPWMMAVGVITMTDHANLWHQRRHKDAEPHFQRLANLSWEAYHNHMPTYRAPGEWHLPFITAADWADQKHLFQNNFDTRNPGALLKVSTGRCARVSYMTHEGKRDLKEDIALHDRLAGSAASGAPMHASPFEHPAMAVGGRTRIKNFTGWKQYRCLFEYEGGPATDDQCEQCGCWGGRHVPVCPAKEST